MSPANVIETETEAGDTAIIRIEGAIDHVFALSPRPRRIVVFDMAAVSCVTSRGVRQWMSMLDDLSAQYYCFTNCRAAVVDQFNLVDGFGKRGELVSLFVPYRCPRCAVAFEQLMRTDHDLLHIFGTPAADCPTCGEPAAFDDDPDVYFQYVRSAPRPRPPAAARAAIDADAGEAPRRHFSLRKEIRGPVTAFRLSGHLDRGSHFRRAANGVEGVVVLDLSDIDGASEEGLTGLAGFLGALEGGASLTRVPYRMLAAIAPLLARPDCAKTDLVSLRAPFVCLDCAGNRWIDIDRDLLGVLGAAPQQDSGDAPACPVCAGQLQPGLQAEEATRVRSAPLVAAEPAVERYLRERAEDSAPEAASPRVAPADDAEPRMLGKYRVIQTLGDATMREVFLARQGAAGDSEKLVILSRIRHDRFRSQHSRDEFVREARLAAALSHPNVVQIYDLDESGDDLLMALEYVKGLDLRQALELSRAAGIIWPIPLCCRITAEVCAALGAAHSMVDEAGNPAPLLHHNVTASNVLLSADGTVKLADLGMRLLDEPAADTAGATARGSPEPQDAPHRADDPRTDIYAVGVVMFECLTLRRFGVTRPRSQPGANAGSLPPPPQLFVWRSGLSPLVQAVFEKAVQPDPNRRYRSARNFELDLLRILKTSPASGRDDLAMWVKRILSLSIEGEGLAVRARGSIPEIVTDEAPLYAGDAKRPPGRPSSKARR